MLYKIGWLVVVIGAMAGDSPCLLAPISIIALGIVMMHIGRRLEDGKNE